MLLSALGAAEDLHGTDDPGLWGVLAGLTTVIFLLLGGRAVIEGTISPGLFTAFFAYLQMLIWPMLGAGFTINMIQRAGASLGRIKRVLDPHNILNPGKMGLDER